MRARNAEIKKLIIPEHSSYPRRSADQEAIDEYLKKHGARQAVNTGKVFSFNKTEFGKGGASYVR